MLDTALSVCGLDGFFFGESLERGRVLSDEVFLGELGIRPESVKQARWRLRSKFGLTSADSLEEFLRRYNSTYNA